MNSTILRKYIDTLESIQSKEIISEASRGLLFRDKGDTFIKGPATAPTETMTFVKAEYFPSSPGEYADYNDMATNAQKIVLSYPGLQFVNSPTNASKSFAILTFDGPAAGEQSYFCRFFQRITVNMAGQWKNSDLPGGWQLTKKSSMKASYGLKPADILPPNATYDNVLSLLNAVSTNKKVESLMPGLKMLLANKLPVFENQSEMLGAIQDDLGEIMAPIALSQGLVTDSGAEAAKKDLLGGKSWEGCTINFPSAKNNGLVDSFVIVDGIEVGISSKGNKGATASIKNVADGVKLARTSNTPAHQKLLNKYAVQIKLVEEIGSKTALDFPLDYAVEKQLISSRAASKIRELIEMGAKTLNQLPSLTSADKELFEKYMSRVNAITSKQNYAVGYHILSVLVKDVASNINLDPDFGAACLAFVNINPIIQIYLTAAVTGKNVVVKSLKSMYPPNFQGTILVDASKNYSATGIGGRLTFMYSPDKDAAAKANQDDISNAETSVAASEKITATKIDQVANGHVNIRPPGTQEPARAKKISPSREKR